MDLKRLEVFCRIVDHKSFTKAAEALLLSQPTVSEHVRHLEEELDEKLLDRLGREVLPTPAGKILYQYAQRMLRLKDEAQQAIEHFRGNLCGHLIMGASTIPGAYLLPGHIAALKNDFPSVQVTLLISGSNNIVRQLLAGDLEIAVIGAEASDSRLESQELFTDEIVLAVAPDHPFARRDQVRLADLESQEFILRERESGTRSVTVQGLRETGFDLEKTRVVAELGNGEAIRQAVRAGIGIAFMSSRAIADDLRHGALVQVAVAGVSLKRPFYLVRRRNRQLTPLGQAFSERLVREANALGR